MEMTETIVVGFLTGLVICCALCLYHIARGPSAPDRMVAIDILGTVVVGFIAIMAAVTAKEYLLDVVMVWAMVSFVGTLALAKFLSGKGLND